MSDPRLAAVTALNQILPPTGAGRSLREVLAQSALTGSDRGLATDLCYGVCRWFSPLNGWLNQQLEKPLKNSAHPVRLALLAALYELWFSERPAHAILNSWPEVLRAMQANWATGLANALLRKATRTTFTDHRATLSGAEYYALPRWLYRRLEQDWPTQAPNIADAWLHPAPLTLRAAPDANLALLAEAGFTVERGVLSPQAIYLSPAKPVQQIPGFFRDGDIRAQFSVQDEAAQLPAQLFSVEKNPARILDACAAPGGKTGQLVERFPQAELVALDVDTRRLARVQENLDRLDLNAQLIAGDATTPADWWDGTPFAAILLDAPCSATGILRRQPDAKWHRRADDIAPLATLQAHLLDALWPLLAPGGELVYATCSILPQENSEQIAAFLERHPDASEQTPAPAVTSAGLADSPVGVQFLPTPDRHDGFYVARLTKARA